MSLKIICFFFLSFTVCAAELQETSLSKTNGQELAVAAANNDLPKIKEILRMVCGNGSIRVSHEIFPSILDAINRTSDTECLRVLFQIKANTYRHELVLIFAELEKVTKSIDGCPKDIAAIIVEYISPDSLTEDDLASVFKRQASNPLKYLEVDCSLELGNEREFIQALKRRDCAKAHNLLKPENINFSFQDDSKMSLLHYATVSGFNSIVETLLANKAAVDAVNAFKETSLMLASTQNRVSIIRLLLRAGADTELVDCNGRKALDLTICKQALEQQFAYEPRKRHKTSSF